MFALIRTRFLVSVAYLVAICLAALAESAYGQFDEPPAPPAAIVEAEVPDAPPALIDAPPAPSAVVEDAPPAPEMELKAPVASSPSSKTTLPQRVKASAKTSAPKASRPKPQRKLHPTYMTRLVRSRQAEMPVTAPTIRANAVVVPANGTSHAVATQTQTKAQ